MLVLMALVAVWAPLGAWVFPSRPLQLGQARPPPRWPHLQAAHDVPAPFSAETVQSALSACLPGRAR